MKHNIGNIYKTNLDGDVELIQKVNSRVVRVRFLNTGFEREVNLANLVAGKCRDYTVTSRRYTEIKYPNTIHSSNSCGDFIMLEKDVHQCKIQFIQTGYTTSALYVNVIVGKIKDPYYPSTHGIGYLGEFKKPSYYKQASQLWRNMMKRCYSEVDKKGYYGKGVSVDSRWLCFANFLEDLPKLENFELWLNGQHTNADKYNLDKDFLCPGNKIYSREVCMFLPDSLNKGLTSRTLKDKWTEINDFCLRK